MTPIEQQALNALVAWIKAEMDYDNYARDRYVPESVYFKKETSQNDLRLAGIRLIAEREGR